MWGTSQTIASPVVARNRSAALVELGLMASDRSEVGRIPRSWGTLARPAGRFTSKYPASSLSYGFATPDSIRGSTDDEIEGIAVTPESHSAAGPLVVVTFVVVISVMVGVVILDPGLMGFMFVPRKVFDTDGDGYAQE